MTKPNNPYAHNVNATKGTAMTVGEFYGTRATDKKNVHAAGNRNVSPAARYQAAGNAYQPPTTTDSAATSAHKPKRGKSKDEPESEPAVTAEDLFQW
jgi:hypothetical protein